MFSTTLRFLLIVLIFNIEPTFQCKCHSNYPLLSSYADAENIFIGKAVQVHQYANWNRREIQFEVETKFKGTFPSSNKIDISTPLHEIACGLSIQVGEKWQVWASMQNYHLFLDNNSTDSQEKSFLSTNRCDLTTKDLHRNIEFLLNPPTNLTNSA